MTEFRLHEDHLKLLRRMRVGWQRHGLGGPTIDAQRPYQGGGLSVRGAIIDAMGWHDLPEQAAYSLAGDIHRETEQALAIVLRFAGLEVRPGLYRLADERDRQSWERVGD